MDNSVYRCCPLCDSTDINNLKKMQFNNLGLNLPNMYYLSLCNKCGFVYANTIASSDDYRQYYKQHNVYTTLPSTFKRYNIHCTDFIKKHVVNKNSKILDIGCGSGTLLRTLQEDGYKYLYGLDPDSRNYDILKEFKIDCIVGDISIDNFKCHDRFDVVILSFVLEHIYDITKSINNIATILNKNALVICNVPNIAEYSLIDTPIANCINLEHINHFSTQTLCNTFNKQGFSVLELSTAISNNEAYIMSAFNLADSKNFSKNKILKYLDECDDRDKMHHKVLNEIVDSSEPICVFGTGNLTRYLLENSNLRNMKIVDFIDNNPTKIGSDFFGYRVKPMDCLSTYSGTILVLSMNYSEEIIRGIKLAGYKNKILTL